MPRQIYNIASNMILDCFTTFFQILQELLYLHSMCSGGELLYVNAGEAWLSLLFRRGKLEQLRYIITVNKAAGAMFQKWIDQPWVSWFSLQHSGQNATNWVEQSQIKCEIKLRIWMVFWSLWNNVILYVPL